MRLSVLLLGCIVLALSNYVTVSAFHLPRISSSRHPSSPNSSPLFSSASNNNAIQTTNVWEDVALKLVNIQDDKAPSREELKDFVQWVSILRVGTPALGLALSAKIAYPVVAITLAHLIDDSGVFAVVAQDASQYIQNILTTSGLVFSLLVGQTYYFMVSHSQYPCIGGLHECLLTTAKVQSFLC